MRGKLEARKDLRRQLARPAEFTDGQLLAEREARLTVALRPFEQGLEIRSRSVDSRVEGDALANGHELVRARAEEARANLAASLGIFIRRQVHARADPTSKRSTRGVKREGDARAWGELEVVGTLSLACEVHPVAAPARVSVPARSFDALGRGAEDLDELSTRWPRRRVDANAHGLVGGAAAHENGPPLALGFVVSNGFPARGHRGRPKLDWRRRGALASLTKRSH